VRHKLLRLRDSQLTALAKVPLCHGQDIKSIQCKKSLVPEFLIQVVKCNEHRLLEQARGANTEGLTLPMLEEIPVLNVPLALQERFATIARRHERLRVQQREALRQAEQFFAALLGRAFRGERGAAAGVTAEAREA
jgi:type I restriction enzyme, S subunit